MTTFRDETYNNNYRHESQNLLLNNFIARKKANYKHFNDMNFPYVHNMHYDNESKNYNLELYTEEIDDTITGGCLCKGGSVRSDFVKKMIGLNKEDINKINDPSQWLKDKHKKIKKEKKKLKKEKKE